VDEFFKLLEQQLPRLRRYAFALHRSNRSRADDLVQDTLVRAIAKQHLWKPGTNLQGWLFTLMHHRHVDDVRRSLKRQDLIYTVEELHDTILASVSDTSASLQLRDLNRAMAKLPIERQEAIRLVALEGMSYGAVAALLDIPVGTVRSRLSRGRVALREMMGMDDTTTSASVDREDRGAPLAA
jgi:RNA polymerase sigma-70 factor (ECF subfamily)